MVRRPPGSTRTCTLFPYTTRFRSSPSGVLHREWAQNRALRWGAICDSCGGFAATGNRAQGALLRGEEGLHLLEGVGLDLADALGADAVFVGQLLQRHLVLVVQPATADDVARTRIQRLQAFARSEERRVGKECVSTFRSRWSPDP